MNKNIQTSFSDGSNIFFTSDTHFNHSNIMKLCNRPWYSVDDMNDYMIERWNSVTDKDSLIFHLGDFSWGNKWMPILNRLNGRKILIMGNHDFKNKDSYAFEHGFEYVTQQMTIKIEHRKVILNHYPLLCYGGTYRKDEDKVYQLFGHVHSGPYSENGLDNKRLINLFSTQYDVGVDNNEFRPISWSQVNGIIQKQIECNK